MIVSRFIPNYPVVLLYMLQASEYNVRDYFDWLHRTKDFRLVMKRKKLDWTNKIKILALAEASIVVVAIVLAILLSTIWLPLALVPLLLLPWLLAYGLVLPLVVGEALVQKPREKRIIAQAQKQLEPHKARKIAIAGSYGKTTTKEVLRAVLSEKYTVAATPGNQNTMLGTSRFIQRLSGNEDVIIFEFGESHVGDVKELSELTKPDKGVITGINQAHLKSFKTIDNTIATIFELRDFLGDKPLYKNSDDELIRTKTSDDDEFAYSNTHASGWHYTQVESSFEGMDIVAKKDSLVVKAHVNLIGEHILGTILLAIAIAERLDMSVAEIERGLERVKPFEHRMEPRKMHGALVIDDTYNGNVKGVEAGLKLLKESGAKRRVYVTPGLVEQGSDTQAVHEHIGELIADSADVVVLMKNSVTDAITKGLHAKQFEGKLIVSDNPLEFYTGLEHFVAAGDVVLMQNDWPDNYA